MDLQALKTAVNEAGLSPEILAKINEIVDGAMTKGNLDQTEKQQIVDLVDLDIEAGVLEADTIEKMSLALDSLAHETEKAVEMADEQEAVIEADVEEKVSKLEDAAKLEKVRQEVPPSNVPTL